MNRRSMPYWFGVERILDCALMRLPWLLGVEESRSGGELDLSCGIPDEAGEFASDRHAAFVLRQPSPHAQDFVAPCQAQLGAPGDVADGFGLALLAHLDEAAHLGFEAVVPCGLDQDAPGVCVAGLGDAALTAGLAGAVIGRHQPKICRQYP